MGKFWSVNGADLVWARHVRVNLLTPTHSDHRVSKQRATHHADHTVAQSTTEDSLRVLHG